MSSNGFGVVGFVLALLVSVMLHEFGHFATAKAFGMKVTQFFVGFGPTLWSTKRGETEYGIKAIPAGGFVRIVGMTPLEEVAPEDEPRAMWRQPAGRKAIVMSAGSAMHFLIGVVILLAVILTIGQSTISTKVGQVSACLPPCSAGAPPSPAKVAGLRPGDTIVTVDGLNVDSWSQVTQRIRGHRPGDVAELVVTRNGEVVVLHPIVGQATYTLGSRVKTTETDSAIGVAPKEESHSVGIGKAVNLTFTNFWQVTTGTLSRLASVPGQIPSLFHTDRPRDSNGLVSAYGAARLGGQAVQHVGLSAFFLIVASLNISIGVFNLLPLLPLDGGHLAIIGYEKARSWLARKLRRPDPGRLDMLKLLPAAYLVIALFASLSLLLVVNDVVNPIVSPF